jgi:hypothetical protein
MVVSVGTQEAAGEWVVAGAERGPDWLGVSAAHSAMAANERAPASTAAAAMARMGDQDDAGRCVR